MMCENGKDQFIYFIPGGKFGPKEPTQTVKQSSFGISKSKKEKEI